MSRRPSQRTIQDAATIALIIGGCDELPYGHPSYREDGFVCLKHCRTCACDCKHKSEWECVAAAIGASPMAVRLFVSMGNALAFDAEAECDTPPDEWGRYIAWLAEIGHPAGCGGLDRWEPSSPDLEVAALLLDGVLPPVSFGAWRSESQEPEEQ
jgi:hypothetical protein